MFKLFPAFVLLLVAQTLASPNPNAEPAPRAVVNCAYTATFPLPHSHFEIFNLHIQVKLIA